MPSNLSREAPAVVAVAFAVVSSLLACGGAKSPADCPPSAHPAPAGLPPKRAEPADAPGPTLGEFTLGKTKVVVEDCSFDPPLEPAAKDPLRAIAATKTHVFLAGGGKEVRAYKKMASGCKLVLDRSVGAAGALATRLDVHLLSADERGRVAASNGVFEATWIDGGELGGECKVNYLSVHPSGAWGISHFVNADVKKVTFEGGQCEAQPWALASMGDDAKRRGPFKSVSAVGFAGGEVLVAGSLATGAADVGVVAFDAAGAEKYRLGTTKYPAADAFGWVQSLDACGQHVCVADDSAKRLSIWKRDGSHVGVVRFDADLGVEGAGVVSVSADGPSALVGFDARGATSATGRVVRVTTSDD